ncbi:MAG: TolC family protein [Elusimicrobiota bacterium]|jgi:outer membrane protein TolC|nr:TolC family protein [Elusimicrobiota bacterium]
MKKIILFLLCLFLQTYVFANQNVSLIDCEKAALNYSHNLKALSNDYEASISAAEAYKTMFYPSLMLEGSAKYIDEIPKLNAIKMGDNLNYSAGIAVYWTFFDAGVRSKNYESLSNAALAQKQQLLSEKNKLLLEVRITYFKTVGAFLVLKLLNEQLLVSIAQNNDIKSGLKYGTKTKIDEALSDIDALNKTKQVKAAQIALMENIMNLNYLTGGIIKEDILKIVSENDGAQILNFDDSANLLKDYQKFLRLSFDENSPQILSFDFLSKAAQLLADAQSNEIFPLINISAKTSFDYPNGAAIETINQNTAAISMSAPIYQFSKSQKLSRQNNLRAQSYIFTKEEIIAELKKLFEFSKQKTTYLLEQRSLNADIISRAKTAAELMYKSYLSGNARFLEVDALNVMVMQAQADEINTDIEILIQLAIIRSLSKN